MRFRICTGVCLVVLAFGVWLCNAAVVKVQDRPQPQAGSGAGAEDGDMEEGVDVTGGGEGELTSPLPPVTNPAAATTLSPPGVTIQDFPTSASPLTSAATANATTTISPPSTTTITSLRHTSLITISSTTTPPLLPTISSTSSPSPTTSSITTRPSPSTATITNNTSTVGNLIYSMWGFFLGGMLTYLSLSDTFRLPLIRTVDSWFGPRSHRHRRQIQDEGLQAYVVTTFSTLTDAIDRINAISDRIKKL